MKKAVIIFLWRQIEFVTVVKFSS